MVMQAEHIPVHLGAMPAAVEAVLDRDHRPGVSWVLNDPYAGGTHLPDVTIVTPVALQDEVVGFVGSRAHHSDVGGMQPGSMPSESRSIFQEGVIIPPLRLVRDGELDEDLLTLILANVRTPELRRADLRAQMAANAIGVQRLQEAIARHGRERFEAATGEVLAYAERRARAVIAELPDGSHTATSEIEGDGVDDVDIPIRARVTIDGDRLLVDFDGTAPAVRGNVNCPLAVTRSACLFALRVLLPSDVPSNAGSAAVLEVRAPAGSLVDARHPSAVVAGNVETSQRVADTVLAALAEVADVPAAGQGTMNNVVIGGAGWTYYETVAGGQGGSSRGPGPSGVHVGMTNTLNTPVEALELEYPMRVERYELAAATGGAGRHRGGDGVVRSIRVLAPATVSLLTDRRRHPPAGARGGGPGAVGHNLLTAGSADTGSADTGSADTGTSSANAGSGSPQELPAKATRRLAAGDVVTVVTPGGGGWGRP
jgi:N-methylhydantoinase B